jgi:hypothetical protein
MAAQLRTNSANLTAFLSSLRTPLQPSSSAQPTSYDDSQWSFGDLERVRELTKAARPGVEALEKAGLAQKRRVGEMQGLLLKGSSLHSSPRPFFPSTLR